MFWFRLMHDGDTEVDILDKDHLKDFRVIL